MKFEKGKKVRIVRNDSFHEFKIGSIVTMANKFGGVGFEVEELINGDSSWVFFSECEEINDKPERYKSREVHGMDVIDLVNYWGLNFQEANILKYLLRDKGEDESDLEKIIDYAQRELKRLRDLEK